MEFDKRRRTASPYSSPGGSTSTLISKFVSTPKRMTKRSKIPPPLQLDSLTPPPTIRKPVHYQQRKYSSPLVNQEGFDNDSFDNIDDDISAIESPTPYQLPKSKSFVNEMCCICEEPITTKLTSERTLELDCKHRCHHGCYLVLLNKDDMSDLPICSLCGVKTKPLDENILEDLFSQTLVQEDDDDDFEDAQTLDNNKPTGQVLDFDTETPTTQSIGLLPPVPLSGFRPNLFNGSSTPYTPEDKMTNNLNSAGFNPSGKPLTPLLTASSAASIYTRRSSEKSLPSPRCSVDDLVKPNVSILSEFTKHTINDNVRTYNMSHMLNIYTNDVLAPRSDLEHTDNELKFSIHDKVIALLSTQVRDPKGVDFSELPTLRMFDCFDVSLDGIAWEYVHAFIFDTVLLLVSEELDAVVGSVMLKEHFTSCHEVDRETLVLYFSTGTLPELQIHSNNNILIAKWAEFFQYKLRQGLVVPLIQMSTNTWDLVDDGSIALPSDVVKFNDLTARGLDLPMQLMKSVMPVPKRLPCVVVACVPLYNDSELENDVYLVELKKSLRLILDELETCDRFGLVLMGRNGKRALHELETTYFGITSADWPQWDDIIDELEVYTGSKRRSSTKMGAMIKSLNKLTSFWPELENRDHVKKLLMVRCGVKDEETDKDLFDFKPVLEKGFTVHDMLISSKYDSFSQGLVKKLSEVDGMRQYHLQRHESFTNFHNSIPLMMQKFKRVLLSSLDVDLSIELSSYVKFSQLEHCGKLVEAADNAHKWTLKLKDLEDGFYTNARFDAQLDIDKLVENFSLNKNVFHDVPLLKYSYSYGGGKTVERKFSIKLCINESVGTTIMSPLDAPQGLSQENYIDIPLLPPLSSFKDSLFVKKQVELLVIETLMGETEHGSVHELVSLVFGLIRGCSTSHVDFFKNSRFNKHKNFSCYVDELVKRLNKIRGDETRRLDLCYKLGLEEELD